MSTPVKIDSSNFGRYTVLAAVNPAAGIGVPESYTAHNRALAVFLCTLHCYTQIMVGRAGASQDAPGSVLTGYANPARLATLEIGVSGGELFKLNTEVAIMASIPTLSQSKHCSTVTTSLSDYLRLLRLSGIPGYIRGVAVNPATGFSSLESSQAHNRARGFFVCNAQSHSNYGGLSGGTERFAGFLSVRSANPAQVATSCLAAICGDYVQITQEAAAMATTPAVYQPQLGVVSGKVVTTSLSVACYFRKPHKDILAKISRLECSPEFTERNFSLSDYTDVSGRKLPCYQITRDGFAFLAMGFTGKRAARFKEAYISAFNEMERKLNAPAVNGPADTTAAHNAHVAYLYMSEIHRVWLSQLYPMLVASESPLAVSLYDYVNDAVFVAGLVDRSLNANRKEATK
ncbi:Rha family phage regulatory protein [Klebsiella sp. PL-2018]|uniref:Rha family phage regulatory protein n=1 Tax=Klebsiella sp. PL-2018 TaxID=2851540 RepID=UPI001C21230A|nr:Rha family phage regulatory protein [Klebsiella sp. PL-2018]QXC99347.1 putative antirepressor [Klebsiella sp. PL-2018]